MGFWVSSIFSVGLDDEIRHSFGFKGCASLRSAHIKFLKEKKRKKRKSSIKWRFQEKQVFSRKYYPAFYDKVVRKWGFDFEISVVANRKRRVEILLKTVGLNFLFLKLELTFTFFLFIFLFSFWPWSFCWRQIESVDEIDDVLRKGCGFLKQKKEI